MTVRVSSPTAAGRYFTRPRTGALICVTSLREAIWRSSELSSVLTCAAASRRESISSVASTSPAFTMSPALAGTLSTSTPAGSCSVSLSAEERRPLPVIVRSTVPFSTVYEVYTGLAALRTALMSTSEPMAMVSTTAIKTQSQTRVFFFFVGIVFYFLSYCLRSIPEPVFSFYAPIVTTERERKKNCAQ